MAVKHGEAPAAKVVTYIDGRRGEATWDEGPKLYRGRVTDA